MSDGGSHAHEMVDRLFRQCAGQMVAHLARTFGPARIDLAEEVVQQALLKALERWPWSGVPENPSGWLFQAARNAALDSVRHDAVLSVKAAEIAAEIERSRAQDGQHDFAMQLRDDELRMLFMCCHPGLSWDAAVPLSLKIVGGFSVAEIARALLCEEPAIAQRLARAKRQIREQSLRIEIPDERELPARLDAVLETIYLIFNEGYAASSGDALIREDLCREALRLARLLVDCGLGEPRVHALVALIALQSSQLPARVDEAGELVLLEEQDRGRCDPELFSLGFRHFSLCSEGEAISQYHVQAAIAAEHARPDGETDWNAILSLYDQLHAMSQSPIVRLNRAVAVARVSGPADALLESDALCDHPRMRGYYLLHAARAHWLLELGDFEAARAALTTALSLRCSEPERRFMRRKLASIQESRSPIASGEVSCDQS
jgi:RNA polymerase sigma-70 factor (ECF subfamily)